MNVFVYISGAVLGMALGVLLYDLLSRKHFDLRMNEAVKKAYKAGLEAGHALPVSWERHTKSVAAPHEDQS